MKMILARHGNTFAAGDKTVWAGSQQDFPLVARGIEQAKELGQVLSALAVKPAAVFSSPLKRTRGFAELILAEMGLSMAVRIDSRLNEIDYGEWGGLSNQEVTDRFGESQQELWNSHSTWPAAAKWGSSYQDMLQAVVSFSQELRSTFNEADTILLVSSNGCLRFFLHLIEGEFDRRCQNATFKVKTGNVCQLDYASGSCRLDYWDQKPADLISRLR